MTSLLRPENVIHIKYIVTILIIKAIILHSFARLCENSARISGGFVFEAGIADAICGWKVTGEGLQWLNLVSAGLPTISHATYTDKTTFRIRSSERRL